ncbi:hypothetical protein M9H77_16896 [Catharanthus roseus]|uniref:Uncharacterized protein n=1 Tax=Catharanthus roseus TaxID=4058 RepID=A0ACC0B3G0_CATRO|nr:hypothetical protein M9H77_16896 [Catharanthus roseus]
METLLLKLRLLLVTWLHLGSRPGSVHLLKQFSYKDIKKATNGFRTVQFLGRLHHRHIAALCGFSTGRKRFLVFENLERGSLKDHLSDPLKTPLNWRTRLEIAVGVAAALEYLHFFCNPPVYYVSINSSTIMLDENFIPKLSETSLLSATENTDQIGNNTIFQLGLLILELVTGQSSVGGGADLVHWVRESHVPRSLNKMIDPDLGNEYDSRELKGLLSVARLCIDSVDNSSKYTSQILRYLKTKASPPTE